MQLSELVLKKFTSTASTEVTSATSTKVASTGVDCRIASRPQVMPCHADTDSNVSHSSPDDNATSRPQPTNGTETLVNDESKGTDTLSMPAHGGVKFQPSTFHPNGIVTLSTFRRRDGVVSTTSECNGDSSTVSSYQAEADDTLTASQPNGTVTPAVSPAIATTVTRQVFHMNFKSKVSHQCL